MTASSPSGAKWPSGATLIIAAVLAAIAGFAAVYVSLGGLSNAPAPQSVSPAASPLPRQAGSQAGSGPLAGLNKGKLAGFVLRSEPQELPAVEFVTLEGAHVSLADWKGRVVLLNLWATWCAPCREEMPALDRLQATLGGEDFEVVAVSSDRGSIDKPKAFFEELGLRHLKLYHDPTGKMPVGLKAIGLPTTILVGRDGREMGRLVGPAEWDSADAVALIRGAVGQGGG